jgi:hypothetical protein
MKTKVIIVDDQNLSDLDFIFLSRPIELQFNNANFVRLNENGIGWMGKELNQAMLDGYDEVVCVPIGVLNVDLPAIREASQLANAPLVLNGFTAGPGGFLSIDNRFAYIDLSFYKENNISMDWGSYYETTEPISVPSVQQLSDIVSSADGSEYITSFGPGWILLIATLRNNGSILSYPIDILTNSKAITDCALRNATPNEADLASINTWMSFVQSVRPCQSPTVIELNLIQSVFNNSNTPVENLYTTADNLDALMVPLHYSRELRIVFFSDNPESFTAIRTIVADWDGTNQNRLSIPAAYQNTLSSLVNQNPNYFETHWTKFASGYIAYFNFDDMALLEDLGTQKHVNNFVFLSNYSESPRSFLFSKLDISSLEVCYQSNAGYSIESRIATEPYIQDLYKRFRITYRNTQTGFQLPTEYDIEPHFLAQKWARALRYDYLEDHSNRVEKNFMLQHWEYDEANVNGRSLTQLCLEMNRYVDYINSYFDGSSERRIKYEITQYFDPATVDQRILNEIHHHFELLIGQVWSVSEYYKLADSATCFAIRQLNNLCHEMESLLRPSFRNSHKWAAGVYFPYLRVARYKFVDSDYDHFTQIQEFGNLCLHYAQLGKTPLEAYAARDEEVLDDNITGLRYMSGEFDIMFMPDRVAESQLINLAKYNNAAFEWIRARGQDPESKYTGIGFVKVANFDRTLFPNLSAEQIMSELVKCDDIYKLELIDSQGTVVKESVLDYTWRDVLVLTDPTLPNCTNEFNW